jgi:hypothetical protein
MDFVVHGSDMDNIAIEQCGVADDFKGFYIVTPGFGVVLLLYLFGDGGYLFFLAAQGVLFKRFVYQDVEDYPDGQNGKQQ